jgi:hypothetical protein
MTRQRDRHNKHTPIEEKVRLGVLELVGKLGIVYVERSGFGDLDSILVDVSIRGDMVDDEFEQLTLSLSEVMNYLVPVDTMPSCCVRVMRNGTAVFLRP